MAYATPPDLARIITDLARRVALLEAQMANRVPRPVTAAARAGVPSDPGVEPPPVKMPHVRVARDTVLITVGIAGLAYETISGQANPTLVVGFFGLLGAPLFVRTDEARKAQAIASAPTEPAPVPTPGPGAVMSAVMTALRKGLTLGDLLSAPSLWPSTMVWAVTIAVIMAATRDLISPGVAIIIAGLAALISVLYQMRRDLLGVHELVNSTHDQLVHRVDALTQALVVAGVDVPADPAFRPAQEIA